MAVMPLVERALDQFYLGHVNEANEALTSAITICPSSRLVRQLKAYVDFARHDFNSCTRDASTELAGTDWHNHEAPYMVILGSLAHISSGAGDTGRQIVQNGLSNCNRTWPYPIMSFIHGDITEAALLSTAKSNAELTDAKTYIALYLQAAAASNAANKNGPPLDSAARENLTWVSRQGNKTSWEFALARALLGINIIGAASTTDYYKATMGTDSSFKRTPPSGPRAGNAGMDTAAAARIPQAYFMTQTFDPRWNPNGPTRSKNCGPACLAMAYKYYGLVPPLATANNPEQFIECTRFAMTGRDNIHGTTNFEDVARGAQAGGLHTAILRTQAEIDQSLKDGVIVIASGCPNAEGSYGPRLGYKEGLFGHFILVSEMDADHYVVCDPINKRGPATISRKEMAAFLSYSVNASLKGGIAIWD